MQAPNRIEVVNGYDQDAYTYYPVLIVGAGESGLAMGVQLKRLLGFDQFRIFDRQSGMGGTWWINRYPGVACDVYVSYGYRFRGATADARLQSQPILLLLLGPLLHGARDVPSR